MPLFTPTDLDWSKECSTRCTPTPLTTAWVAPTSCSEYWTPYSTGQASQLSMVRNVTASGCVPSQVLPKSGQRDCRDCPSSSGLPWISPGVCPKGWPTASAGILGNITTGYCCPPEAPTYMGLPEGTVNHTPSGCVGYITGTLVTLHFDNTFYTPTSALVAPTAAGTAEWSTYPVSASVRTNRTITYLYYAAYTASPLVVRYKQEEFASTASSASNTNTPNTTSNTLSTGAKAGVGVGAAFAVLALLIIGLMLYKRRQGIKAAQTAASPQEANTSTEQKAELHNETAKPKEMPAQGYSELDTQDPSELGEYR